MDHLRRLDTLDVALLRVLKESPRSGILSVARLLGVARATVQARLDWLERTGVVTGYGPDIDLSAAGYPIQALVALQIAQGTLEDLKGELAAIPAVVEAYATTGSSDVSCRLAAPSNDELQETLLQLSRLTAVARTTSMVILSVVVAPRSLQLLEVGPLSAPHRPPSYRHT
jgi:DNA-binding Lrp family transcriptional regulator